MVWTDLNLDLQNVLLHNYDQFGKSYLLFLILSVSLIYRFYFKNKRGLTSYYSVGVMRFLLDRSSTAFLVLSPFYILYMNPAYPMGLFAADFTKIFGVVMIIYLVLLGIDIIRLGVFGVAVKCGLDVNDPTINKFLKDVDKKKNLLKW